MAVLHKRQGTKHWMWAEGRKHEKYDGSEMKGFGMMLAREAMIFAESQSDNVWDHTEDNGWMSTGGRQNKRGSNLSDDCGMMVIVKI